ncbi:MAG TPA: archaetidylserine decarboxylase [Anaeromyxobacteraceae bacterium]|nr:archaetidylserine decarboxylase [Anaeromyxobacteraceae bacterium]
MTAAKDRALLGALRFVPKNALSRFVGVVARANAPSWLRIAAIRIFAARYRIDLSECDDLVQFSTFADFFARPLKPGRRPIVPGEEVIVSPVDGVVSQAGWAQRGELVQAKGLAYPLAGFLGDRGLAARFEGGASVTIYLSPREYHRIHFPLGGSVVGYRYIPGSLWPVNALATRVLPGLLAANERLVTVLETPLGLCAVVAVGATVVGRIRAYYDPGIPVSNRPRARRLERDYASRIPVDKGEQLGAFEMGSTVVLLFEMDKVLLRSDLGEGVRVRVGEAIGGRLQR